MSAAPELNEPPNRRGLILVILCAGQAMVFVDVSIVNVALPSIGRELGIAEGQLLQIAVMDSVDETESGLIGGIFGTSQEAGGAIALALATTAAFAGQTALTGSTRFGFAIACGFALAALAVSAASRRPGRRQQRLPAQTSTPGP